MDGNVGLRERKRARIKLRILEIVASMFKEKTFDEIGVESICDRAEISKVTFFKYFAQKDEILPCFMRVWCFRRTVEAFESSTRGIAAIRRLFEEATRDSTNYPKARLMMISLVSYLAKLQARPAMPDLEPAEKRLLFPGDRRAWELRVLTLDQLFLRHLREAVEDGELGGDADLGSLAKMLVSIFYGAAVSGVIFQETDMPAHYRMHLEFLLRGCRANP